MSVPAPHIIVCKTWGALPPKERPVIVGKPDKIIIHHTDGHAIGDGSTVDNITSAFDYARNLQHMHMTPPRDWNDSGHNFLVMRSGLILQGRWGTVSAIERGRMVESAHCPGQNGNPGIEHEHLPGEQLTTEQRSASIMLMAWICGLCKIPPTNLYGHNQFYATACPSNLQTDIMGMRNDVAATMNHWRKSGVVARRGGSVRLAIRRELRAA